jgi:hypothetical protein
MDTVFGTYGSAVRDKVMAIVAGIDAEGAK